MQCWVEHAVHVGQEKPCQVQWVYSKQDDADHHAEGQLDDVCVHQQANERFRHSCTAAAAERKSATLTDQASSHYAVASWPVPL